MHALLLVYWPSHGIAIDQSLIGFKEIDNIASVQWGMTVCFDQVFTSQFVTSTETLS